MRKLITFGLCLVGCAAAQTKTSGVGKCSAKPETQQSVEVGDRAGHMIVLVKQTCDWTTPMEIEGLKGKSYTVSITSDVSGTKSTDRGYVVIAMDNGDKAFVRINTGMGTMGKEGPESGEGTWSFTGGTGKLRGLTGKGTYKSKTTAGVGEDTVEGEYSISAPAAKSAPKKK